MSNKLDIVVMKMVIYIFQHSQICSTCLIFYLLHILGEVDTTKCFKEAAIGDRSGNVYYCSDVDKSECCEQNSQFTCCESQNSKTLREQLILWGCVSALVVATVALCCYFWKDGPCSSDNRPLVDKYCGCCQNEINDDERKLTSITRPMYSKSQFLNSPVHTVSSNSPISKSYYEFKNAQNEWTNC